MNNKEEEEKKKMSMNMSNIKITKYNPKLKLDEDCDECNFYEQLSDREKEEYNDLQINFLDRKINMWYEEISLNDLTISDNKSSKDTLLMNLSSIICFSDIFSYRIINNIFSCLKPPMFINIFDMSFVNIFSHCFF